VLVKPDVPLAAIDPCFRANTFVKDVPLIAEAYSDHPAGRWVYVASFHACQSKDPLEFRVALSDLGPSRPRTPVMVFDWRRGDFQRLDLDSGWDCRLDFQDWDYRVLCPVLPGDVTVFGDVAAPTAGDHRFRHRATTQRKLQRSDQPDAMVEVHGFSPAAPTSVSAWVPGSTRAVARDSDAIEAWSWDSTGRWIVRVRVGTNGHTRVRLEMR
jgi:hypothetical protein